MLTHTSCAISSKWQGLRTTNLVHGWRTITRINHRRHDLQGQRSRSQVMWSISAVLSLWPINRKRWDIRCDVVLRTPPPESLQFASVSWMFLTLGHGSRSVRVRTMNTFRRCSMFIMQSSWQSHCKSSPNPFDECRTTPSGCRPSHQAKWLRPPVGCQSLHPPSSFIILITQSESWYSFQRSTEGRRLSQRGWLVTYRAR